MQATLDTSDWPAAQPSRSRRSQTSRWRQCLWFAGAAAVSALVSSSSHAAAIRLSAVRAAGFRILNFKRPVSLRGQPRTVAALPPKQLEAEAEAQLDDMLPHPPPLPLPSWVSLGMRVEVRWSDAWHECEVLAVSKDGKTCSVIYDDGEEEQDVPIASRVRQVQPPWVREGMFVEVEYQGTWYECEVLEVADDGKTCKARYFDGGDEEPGIHIASRVRPPRVPLHSIYLGQCLQGTVRDVQRDGATVDVGAEKDGFLHMSRLPPGGADGNALDLLERGSDVIVWVCGVDAYRGRLELTMVEGSVGGRFGTNPPAEVLEFRRQLLGAPSESDTQVDERRGAPTRRSTFGPSPRLL